MGQGDGLCHSYGQVRRRDSKRSSHAQRPWPANAVPLQCSQELVVIVLLGEDDDAGGPHPAQ